MASLPSASPSSTLMCVGGRGEGASSFLPSSLLSVYEFVFIILFLCVNFVAVLPAAERKRVCVVLLLLLRLFLFV